MSKLLTFTFFVLSYIYFDHVIVSSGFSSGNNVLP